MHFRPSILLTALVFVAAGCGGGYGSDATNTPTGPNPPSTPRTPSNPTATNQVTVSDNTFTPADVTVPVNTSVRWTWADGASLHNVTFADGGSGDRAGGAEFIKLFPNAGTFDYHCTIHPNMAGSVVVTP
jgi:plastocyanin